jgi:hypothetical protein
VTVQVQERSGMTAAQPPDDVHAGMALAVLGTIVRHVIAHVVTELTQLLAEKLGNLSVVFPGGIHARNAYEVTRELHHLVLHGVDRAEGSFGGEHGK